MPLERYIRSGGKLLRCGYTTGSCAAMAAGAATRRLITGTWPDEARITTPKGWEVEATIEECSTQGRSATCAVRKDAGDDADATANMLIFATVTLRDDQEVTIDGGTGVGRVTKPGLDQPVGAAAINSTPRAMIAAEVRATAAECGHEGGADVVIWAPEGPTVALKTFNSGLGIIGGISILGTSGIVEPMSLASLIASINLEIDQAAALGAKRIVLTPGNYGTDFLSSHDLGIDLANTPQVKCSNFIGDALDEAVDQGFEHILLVAHAGKLSKVAGGIMNTHSRTADCRVELFCAHAAACGANTEVCRRIMQAATSDACIEILDEAGMRAPVIDSLLQAVDGHLKRRVGDACNIAAIMFSNEYGLLGATPDAQQVMEAYK